MKGTAIFPSVFGRLFSSGSTNPMSSGISMKTYRRQVMRDLRWLMNSRCHPRSSTIHRYPHVASSVINYGMLDLIGTLESHVGPEDVIHSVKSAILRFEPRILPSSVVVSLIGLPNQFDIDLFALEIQGDLWALPVNEPLTLRSQWSAKVGRWQLE